MKKVKALVILVLLFAVFTQLKNFHPNQIKSPDEKSLETMQIKNSSSLDEKVKLYARLIEKVGPEQAQEELLHSGLPFDGETHLLNHTVGDFLYDKYKTKGLVYCRDFFLSSCYHGFVIRAMADGGLGELTQVMDNCWKVGERVAIQCAHAIGHGFLAFDGYKNFVQALEDCDRLGAKSEKFPHFNCYDGAFMENVFAVHDDGKPSPDRWLNKDDPIYPCNEGRIPQKYIRACWSNQPSWMYQLFAGDLHKVAQQCLNLPLGENQTTCFDGLARQIHPLTAGSVDETFRLCSLMPPPWIDPCLISISKAFFSVGDRKAPFEICSGIHPESKNNCYEQLSIIINLYSQSKEELKNSCKKIENSDWTKRCLGFKTQAT